MEFEPFLPRVDPYPVYRELRDAAPAHYARQSDTYVLSRYADVERAFRTPAVYSSKIDRRRQMQGQSLNGLARARMAMKMLVRLRVPPRSVVRGRILINEDGESHAAMRRIVNRGFTPRRIAAWEKRARELAEQGVARLLSGRPFDLVRDLAVPLPVTIIAEMLGVESERMADFKRWSDALITGSTGFAPDATGQMLDAMAELRAYVRPIVKARRASPTDDLISALVTANTDADLDDFEIYLFVLLLLLAGNETTTNLLGNAVDALLAYPDQLALVRSDPTRVPALVEEALRWDSPVQMLQRRLRADVELHGVQMPAGAHVSLVVGAANRDERQFSDPDCFDVAREVSTHLAFGVGAHFCLGASLARLEARAALEALVPVLGDFERANGQRELVDSFVVRGVRRLELRAAA